MDGCVTPEVAWVDARVAGAPTTLADRVRTFAAAAPAGPLVDRLAAAGEAALAAAAARGGDRAAALDLLAADALITLALLDIAERTPGRLAAEAARLRTSVVTSP